MTRRSSRLRTWWLCSALATAERRTFSTIRAAARGVYWSVASASPTDFPRIWSSTSRAFRADTRTKRARASVRTALRLPRGRGRSLLSRAVRLERAGHRELTQPVTDHVLRDVDRDELLAVVDGERVADELRRDRRAARPRLQHLLLPAPVQLLHPREQRLVDVRPLLERTPHRRLLFLPSRHDVAVRWPRRATRLVARGRLAPRGHRVIALALALAAAHRVVDGVHHRAAHRRAEAEPAHPARLPDRYVLVIEVAHLPDRRHAVDRHHSHLARRQLERRPLALLRQELRLRAGAPAHLRAAARLELHVVNERADRDIAERQRVARQDVGLRSRHDGVAHFEAERRDDVALLAVTVVEQCEPCGAIGIILDPRHARRDAELLTPEVHRAEHALRPAAAVAHGDPPVRIAPARPPLGREQALLRLLPGDFLGRDVREVPAGRRGRLDGADSHDRSGSFDQLDLVARLERHNRLLPVPPSALKASHPLELPLERRGPDRRDLDVEHRLDGGADLDLVGVRSHAEGDGVVLFLLAHALLGHERADQDLAGRARHCIDRRRAGRLRGWPAVGTGGAVRPPPDPPGAGRLRGWPAVGTGGAVRPPPDPPGAGRLRGWPAVGTGGLIPPTPARAPGARRARTPPVGRAGVDRPRRASAPRRSATARCATRARRARRARARRAASAHP